MPKATATSQSLMRRVNVNLPAMIYEALESLAKRRGTTMAEVLKNAVALEAFLERELEQGNHLGVKNQKGEFREIIFRDRPPTPVPESVPKNGQPA